jgi:glycosyltransferase involved in cell wall biosynthesis
MPYFGPQRLAALVRYRQCNGLALAVLGAMRICILSVHGDVHGIGGLQDHTSDLARGLMTEGHAVDVISARHPHGLTHDVRDGVRWWFVDAVPHWMDPAWRRLSCETFATLHRERPFDVVHGQASSALELVRRRVHRRVAVVTMFHGNFVGLARAAWLRALTGRSLRRALAEAKGVTVLCRNHFPNGNWYRFRECEAIVPSRQQLKPTCRSHRLDPARVHVVPNGVDTSVFRPSADRAESRRLLGLGQEPLFASAGRLNREKGFQHAIAALAALGNGCASARLLIVGDGEERSRLEFLTRSLGVEERVLFTGRQPPRSVAAYLAAADAFVLPTERDEAGPRVLPQAMACGLPVIASGIGGITEVVDRPGKNGLLIPAGDVPALVEAMRAVLTDEGLRSRLEAGARERVLGGYTLERMTARTLGVYRIAQQRI